MSDKTEESAKDISDKIGDIDFEDIMSIPEGSDEFEADFDESYETKVKDAKAFLQALEMIVGNPAKNIKAVLEFLMGNGDFDLEKAKKVLKSAFRYAGLEKGSK